MAGGQVLRGGKWHSGGIVDGHRSGGKQGGKQEGKKEVAGPPSDAAASFAAAASAYGGKDAKS